MFLMRKDAYLRINRIRIVKSGSNRYHISTKHGRATLDTSYIKTIYIMQILKEDCIKTNPDRTVNFISPVPVLQEKTIMRY